jgi:hypothetical protein
MKSENLERGDRTADRVSDDGGDSRDTRDNVAVVTVV